MMLINTKKKLYTHSTHQVGVTWNFDDQVIFWAGLLKHLRNVLSVLLMQVDKKKINIFCYKFWTFEINST